MPLVQLPVHHIALNNANDPMGDARRHLGRQMERGISQQHIVEEALRTQARHSGATTASSVTPPDFSPVELYYAETQAIGAATEENVIAALQAS